MSVVTLGGLRDKIFGYHLNIASSSVYKSKIVA